MTTLAPAISTQRRLFHNRLFLTLCLAATTLAIVVLFALVASVGSEGGSSLSGNFLDSFASRKPAQAGIKGPLWGSLWVCTVCGILALPIGVATAIYLEEFAPRGRVTNLIRMNISNLSGVPSIVYGIIGLTAFTRFFGLLDADQPFAVGDPESFFYFQLPLGASVLAGALTLMLVILPIVIVASQEALRAVPSSLRTGAMALGATRWQTTWQVTLPAATGSIMTGAILAISRAVGEAAPLLVIGGYLLVFTTPSNLMSDFTVLPLQIFNWAQRPQEAFHAIAAAAIIVQLGLLLIFNSVAVFIRQRLQKPLQ